LPSSALEPLVKVRAGGGSLSRRSGRAEHAVYIAARRNADSFVLVLSLSRSLGRRLVREVRERSAGAQKQHKDSLAAQQVALQTDKDIGEWYKWSPVRRDRREEEVCAPRRDVDGSLAAHVAAAKVIAAPAVLVALRVKGERGVNRRPRAKGGRARGGRTSW